MADLKISLGIKIEYNEELSYEGNDILMAEALVDLIKRNKSKFAKLEDKDNG